MIEPITDEEIQQIKDKARKGAFKAIKVKQIAMIFTIAVFFIVFITSTIYALGWHSLTLVGVMFTINLITQLIARRYAK